MDRTRRRLLTASGALAAAALAGCAEEVDPTATPTASPAGTPADDPTATEEEQPSGDPRAPTERLAELAAGNAAFALDLHRYLADDEGGNVFVSPYSISVALAMTYAGARGETETQMRETLHYTLGADVHPAFADLQSHLESRSEGESEDGGVQLDVANALWGREGYGFDGDYLDLVDEHYGGGLRRADFAGDPNGERERINGWVAEQTQDRIQDLLPPGSIDASTVLVLTNAVYFLANWAAQFDPDETEEEPFTALDGSETDVPMMQQELEAGYADVPGAEAIELPYEGEEVSMVLILPEAGEFDSFEEDLDAETLFGIFGELRSGEGTVAMPRFEFDSGFQLADVLSELGMPDAFGGSADFSAMQEGDGPLFVDDVFHEAFVRVDEEGTEAAAATGVAMADSAGPEPFDVRFDRPFIFCIRDRPTDAVLFLGRVTDAGEIAA